MVSQFHQTKVNMSISQDYPISQYTANATPIEVVVHTPNYSSNSYKSYSDPHSRGSFYTRVEAIAESKFTKSLTEYVGNVIQNVLDYDSTILPTTIKKLCSEETTQVKEPSSKFTDELSLAELGMSRQPVILSLKTSDKPYSFSVKKCIGDFV